MLETKGFLIIAFGKKYQKIAFKCLKSYKCHNKHIPMAIITDSHSKYTNKFDKIIIHDNFCINKPIFNQLYIDLISPYDITILLESDTLIFGDISYFFDLLNKPDDLLGFGYNNYFPKPNSKYDYFLFDKKLVKKEFGKDKMNSINACVLNINKNGKTKKVFEIARKLFEQNKTYGFPFYGNEPYFSVSMAINDCDCYDKKMPIAFYPYIRDNNIKIIEANIKKGILKLDEDNTYSVLHFTTIQTNSNFYKIIYYTYIFRFRFIARILVNFILPFYKKISQLKIRKNTNIQK